MGDNNIVKIEAMVIALSNVIANFDKRLQKIEETLPIFDKSLVQTFSYLYNNSHKNSEDILKKLETLTSQVLTIENRLHLLENPPIQKTPIKRPWHYFLSKRIKFFIIQQKRKKIHKENHLKWLEKERIRKEQEEQERLRLEQLIKERQEKRRLQKEAEERKAKEKREKAKQQIGNILHNINKG